MAAVHSSCRLCIHVATKIRVKEDAGAPKRPRKCTSNSGHTLYHLYVRERGRFYMESIFVLDSDCSLVNLEKAVLDKFRSLNHVPVWKTERPEVVRGNSDLRIYKIYPVGLTQREALHTWSFGGDKELKTMEMDVSFDQCEKRQAFWQATKIQQLPESSLPLGVNGPLDS